MYRILCKFWTSLLGVLFTASLYPCSFPIFALFCFKRNHWHQISWSPQATTTVATTTTTRATSTTAVEIPDAADMSQCTLLEIWLKSALSVSESLNSLMSQGYGEHLMYFSSSEFWAVLTDSTGFHSAVVTMRGQYSYSVFSTAYHPASAFLNVY